MTGTAVGCRVCSSPKLRERLRVHDVHYGNPGEWCEMECSECGSFRLEPLPTEKQLVAMYPEQTYYAYSVRRLSRAQRLLGRALGASLTTREPTFDKPGRVLDFGCGAGDFLLGMRER